MKSQRTAFQVKVVGMALLVIVAAMILYLPRVVTSLNYQQPDGWERLGNGVYRVESMQAVVTIDHENTNSTALAVATGELNGKNSGLGDTISNAVFQLALEGAKIENKPIDGSMSENYPYVYVLKVGRYVDTEDEQQMQWELFLLPQAGTGHATALFDIWKEPSDQEVDQLLKYVFGAIDCMQVSSDEHVTKIVQ